MNLSGSVLPNLSGSIFEPFWFPSALEPFWFISPFGPFWFLPLSSLSGSSLSRTFLVLSSSLLDALLRRILVEGCRALVLCKPSGLSIRQSQSFRRIGIINPIASRNIGRLNPERPDARFRKFLDKRQLTPATVAFSDFAEFVEETAEEVPKSCTNYINAAYFLCR